MDRKSEAGHACQHCGDEEPFRPTVEAFPGEQPEQYDEAGKNSDKADERVNYCVDVQHHVFLPLWRYALMNASNSSFSLPFRVEHIPWGEESRLLLGCGILAQLEATGVAETFENLPVITLALSN